MSHLPPQAIAEFQELWQERYGEPLPPEDALQRAHQVFDLINILMSEPSGTAPFESTRIEIDLNDLTSEINS